MKATILTFLPIIFLMGCGSSSMEDYKETVHNGISTVPHVQEIQRLFPKEATDHFITHYGFDKSKPVTWNTEVFFGGRYVLTYQVDVIVDYERKLVSKTVSPPKFAWREATNISTHPIGADFGAGDFFGEAEWSKVLAAKGDFTTIGWMVKTNMPVPNFEKYVDAVRRDRVRAD